MIVTLIDHTQNPEALLGKYAAICYDSDSSEAACLRRVKSVVNKGHLAVLRFAYATFSVSGISRVCSHQMVRMAHAGILQESQRYVKQSDISFVSPPNLCHATIDFQKRWSKLQEDSVLLYNEAILENFLNKEDARYILPQSCTTKLNLCLNFQAWRDFLKNRADKAAQWEVREVALEIQRHLHELAPQIF